VPPLRAKAVWDTSDTRQETPVFLDPDVAERLSASEVVLGVVGEGLSEACRQELNAGMVQGKHMIVMSDPGFAARLEQHFGTSLVVMDPQNPDQSEHSIVERLRAIDAQQNAKNALLALGTLALGLLILAPADRS
jgi:hypothetical protein